MKKKSIHQIRHNLKTQDILKQKSNIKGGLRVFATHNYQEYVNHYYSEVCDKGFGHDAVQSYSSANGYTVCYDW